VTDPTAIVDPTVAAIDVRPGPGPQEAAAIAAAVQVVLAGVATGGPEPGEMPRWRFSGRWWSKPVPQRRDRP
jgi:hypothetical protein